ncbi:MAG TPA: tail fiber protein [Pyrinomonadaceae bacterium]|jgi:microcystin-dependent protein
MDEFIAIIKMFGGNFAPRGWAFCNGQIMSIAQNTALFSLLGTTFGGNGQTTFGLPDMRGRVPIHPGQGPGLSPYSLGQQAGTENVTLNITQIPAHMHPFAVPTSSATANSPAPANNVMATGTVTVSGNEIEVIGYRSGVQADGAMQPGNTGPAGGNQPSTIIQPYLCVNFIICLEGIFPSRN